MQVDFSRGFEWVLWVLMWTMQGAALTLVPWVLVFFGPQIRARSRLASVSLSFFFFLLLLLHYLFFFSRLLT